MQLLRAADRLVTPWKNGGGLTREVAVSPAGAGFETFDWRISIASVQKDGPFSHLPGIDRRLAVLEGRVALTLGQQASVELSPDSPAITLAGDTPTHARLSAGAVTDLNVMTRRGRFRSTLLRKSLSGSGSLPATDATTVILACTSLRFDVDGVGYTLEPWDGALVHGPIAASVTAQRASAVYWQIELFDLQLKK